MAAVIPIGPGHENVYRAAVRSVVGADWPPGFDVVCRTVDDTRGELGRSAARNIACEDTEADWFLFLDADDLLEWGAPLLFANAIGPRPELRAVWGEPWNESQHYFPDGTPVWRKYEKSPAHTETIDSFARLVEHGPFGALHVGHFVHREAWERVGGWLEAIDIGEDIEFNWGVAAHVPFTQVVGPLAKIRVHVESSRGPRGYGRVRADSLSKKVWRVRAEKVWAYWRERGPVPWTPAEIEARASLYGGFGGDGIL